MMTQKEFKTTMLAQLYAALVTATEFDKDDLSKIESLRGGIKYQIQQLSHDPSYKSEAELKIYRKEIRDNINESKSKINSVYQKYGWIVIRFPNDKGQYRLVNARQEIQRVISKVKGLTDAKLQPKKYIFREESPKAARFEIFEGIVKINKEGWFSDGHVLLKGDAPKDATIRYENKQPVDVEWLLNLESKPARLLYFFFYRLDDDIGRQYISDLPLPTYFYRSRNRKDSIDPSIVFECNGKFWCYNQNKYNLIANRYQDVDRFEICDNEHQSGYLKFYVGDEIIGLMTPYQIESDTIYVTEPPLKEMAIKVGLYKEKLESTLEPQLKAEEMKAELYQEKPKPILSIKKEYQNRVMSLNF